MDVDSSDILGQQTYPKVKEDLAGRSTISFTVKAAFALACVLVLYVLVMRVWDRVLVWREISYKLSMRRRYGIPDNDHRPFNVAYADVVEARRNNEAAKRPLPASAVSTDRSTAPSQPTLRQRPSSTPYVPGAYSSFAASAEPQYFLTNGRASTDRYNLRTSAAPSIPSAYETSSNNYGPVRRSSRKNLSVDGDADVRKRTIEEQDEDEEHGGKKSKVEGDEFIDGEEDAEWEDQNGYVPIRGSKRGIGEEEEGEDIQSEHIRDKRARKVSLEKIPQTYVFEEMDVDIDEAGDEVPDLRASSNRGKKRDRAEAGSTFGGDDEESAPEQDEDDARSRRRRRKRRTVSKRKSDAASNARGKKRDRDIEDSGSDMENEEEMAARASRKKRGKRGSLAASRLDDVDRSDNESLASSKGRRRRIGEEWESNGIKWKIGPNGQRLRQALVKKARQKFVMPRDSQHPDREANLEVFVETWLTEEEYHEAKSNHLLAWQDSPKQSAEPETLSVDTKLPQTPQVHTGKNLLWNSAANTPMASPVSASPAQNGSIGIPAGRQLIRDTRHQPLTSSTLRTNPFDNPQKVATKRIAVAPGTPRGNLHDSTNGTPRVYKTYSKWEKQELEARAMNKIREGEREKQEKLRAEKEQLERETALKERLQKEKADKEQKDKEAAAATAAAKPPAITFAPAGDKPATSEPAKPSPFSFNKPTAEPPKVDASKPSLFNAPPLGSASFAALGESSAKTADKPAAPFGFPSSAAAGSGTSLTSATPNFFSKPTVPATSTPAAASPFGQPSAAPASTESKKPSPFSFGAPSGAPTLTATAAPSAQTSNRVFSFGGSNTTEKKDVTPGSAASTPSLLARIGAPNAPAEQSKTSSATQQSQSPFSFSKPETTKVASPFGAPSATPQAATTQPASGATTAPVFNFAFTGAAKTASTAPPASSSLNGALGEGTSGSSGSAFNTTEANKDLSKPAPPKFDFALPAGGTANAFGIKPATATGSSESKEAPKSAFSLGTTTNSTSSTPAPSAFSLAASSPANNIFGTKTAVTTNGTEQKEAPKSVFAPSSTTTPAAGSPNAFGSTGFGGSSNVFGGGSSSNAFGGSSASKTSMFGAPSSTSSTPAVTSEAPKAAFGSTASSATPANSSPSPFSFNFGASKAASTTPFGTPAGVSAFGGSSTTPSAFGFGAAGNNTANAFGSGTSGTSSGQQQ